MGLKVRIYEGGLTFRLSLQDIESLKQKGMIELSQNYSDSPLLHFTYSVVVREIGTRVLNLVFHQENPNSLSFTLLVSPIPFLEWATSQQISLEDLQHPHLLLTLEKDIKELRGKR